MAKTKLKDIDIKEINEAVSHFYEQYFITDRKQISFIIYMRRKIKGKILFRYFLAEFNRQQLGWSWYWNKNLKKWSKKIKKMKIEETETEAEKAKIIEKKEEDKRLKKLIYGNAKKRKLQKSKRNIEELRNLAFRPQNAITSHTSVWTVKKR